MEYVVATEWQLARQGGQLILDHKQGGKAINKDQLMSKEYFDRVNANTESNGRVCVENKTKTKEALQAIEDKKAKQLELVKQSKTLAKGNLAMDLLSDLAEQALKDKQKGGQSDN
jgi:hypothetical protein